jgi:NAD(P)-dependent dehydrogenase (short-subunit alcohol dehydrogenase family)
MTIHLQVQGCTALVTGASRGLGKAMVEGLLAGGAALVYAGGREAPEASRWANTDRVVPLQLSIENLDHVNAAVDSAQNINLLVNNAGVEFRAPLLGEPNLDYARREMEVNYFGPLNMCRAFAPALRRNHGAIVNILSLAALANIPAVGSYSASKAAARSMTQGIRAQLRPDGVPVYAVYPGSYDTDMAVGFQGELNPPSLLVDTVLCALADGAPLEIFPDSTGKFMEQLLLTDPYELERQCGLYMPDDSFGRVGRAEAGGKA